MYNQRNTNCRQNVTRSIVINKIKLLASLALARDQKKIHIYYTGHGEAETGNWCFNDVSTVSLIDVLSAISSMKKLLKNNQVLIVQLSLDCCLSGNWACIKLPKYKQLCKDNNLIVYINAASFPHKNAWLDEDQGSAFTIAFCSKKTNQSGYDGCNAVLNMTLDDKNKQYKIDYIFNNKKLNIESRKKEDRQCLIKQEVLEFATNAKNVQECKNVIDCVKNVYDMQWTHPSPS